MQRSLYAATNFGLIEGERLPVVVELLQREARALSTQINPFDRSLRRPAEALGGSAHGKVRAEAISRP